MISRVTPWTWQAYIYAPNLISIECKRWIYTLASYLAIPFNKVHPLWMTELFAYHGTKIVLTPLGQTIVYGELRTIYWHFTREYRDTLVCQGKVGRGSATLWSIAISLGLTRSWFGQGLPNTKLFVKRRKQTASSLHFKQFISTLHDLSNLSLLGKLLHLFKAI